MTRGGHDVLYVIEQAREQRVKFVQLWFTDILGFLKSVTVTVDELPEVLEHGEGFDGASIEGYARHDESDMVAQPDPATWQVLPQAAGRAGPPTARMFCDIHEPSGSPHRGDPRQVLRRALGEARRAGFTYYVGPELEFFLFRSDKGDPEPLDRGGYFEMTPEDVAGEIRKEVAIALEGLGIGIESLHHEGAPSQHEVDMRYTDALTMADAVMTTRLAIKEIALRRGVHATFMPKPIAGVNGSGLHVHQSLFQGERNAFYDAADPARLSATARGFIAGLLRHAREIALVTNQWVNSYKRLVPGYEAPVAVSWAMRNRADLVRVPAAKSCGPAAAGEDEPSRAHRRELATRVEYRAPDPACNPYLAFACMLRAGLAGIAGGYALPEAAQASGELPRDLGEAIAIAERSELLRETLGAHVFEKLIENKRLEWDAYRTRVTRWEVEQYLGRL